MKKIFINFLSIAALFLIFDYMIFYIGLPDVIKKNSFSLYRDFYSDVNENTLYRNYILGENDFYRETENKASEKKPILLFGCSFVYGHKVKENETMSHILAKYTDRPIYNRAKHGFGVQNMLYQLQNDDFYKIVPQPEYIIYTYIGDHIRRLYLPSVVSLKEYYDIRYKLKNQGIFHAKGQNKTKHLNNELKNSELVRQNPNFPPHTVLMTKIRMLLWNKGIFVNKEKNREFLKQHFLASKDCVDRHWKGSKFVIFVYLDGEEFEKIAPELEKAGFIIINRSDIADFDIFSTEYTVADGDIHPNKKAWETILPVLIKKIESVERHF